MVQTTVRDSLLKRISLIPDWDEKHKNLIADFALAQCKFETANFTSNIFKKYNNVCGYMKFSGSPYQVQGAASTTVVDGTYAVFPSVENSAYELGDWIKRRKSQFTNVKTSDEYVSVLKLNGYFTTPLKEYQSGVKKFLSVLNVTALVSGSAGLIGGAAILLMLWLKK